MGLDMYLHKRTYVKNWEYMGPEERHTVTVTGPAAATLRPERVTIIEEEVAYWRKANAIHAWLVERCQGGVDDCRTADVSRFVLNELRHLCASLCEQRRAHPRRAVIEAKRMLPPSVGAFFGTRDIDDKYWADLHYTAETLAAVLAEGGDAEFTYRASW